VNGKVDLYTGRRFTKLAGSGGKIHMPRQR